MIITKFITFIIHQASWAEFIRGTRGAKPPMSTGGSKNLVQYQRALVIKRRQRKTVQQQIVSSLQWHTFDGSCGQPLHQV